MLSFLTELQINLAIGTSALVCGVIFSQSIKDKLRGIPGEVRTALKGVELDTVAKISAAQATVLATLPAPPLVGKIALPPELIAAVKAEPPAPPAV
jgi:hypothetical protein